MPTQPPPPIMPLPNTSSIPLTLIVATTSNLGIGRAGTLPWPSLKGEMSYFARVTKRVLPPSSSNHSLTNAVIMGRKTWESIPTRFRPLKGRINVVISRSTCEKQHEQVEQQEAEEIHHVPSLPAALSLLSCHPRISRAFVIGGAQIYKTALEHAATERVLLTKIRTPEYDCDTFFPLDLEGGSRGWRRAEEEELREFTGEVLEGGTVRVEGDVEYEFCLFVKNEVD